ncbi:MAG: flagellar hook capping FlgD N-terminal domain-containing protein [Pseudomonadota bacterium]
MNITSIIPPSTTTAGVTTSAARSNQALDQAAFLRLMTAQLSFQDPTKPLDNQAMVAQLAQFSSVAGISETNTSLRSIADQLKAQTALLNDIRSATLPPATTPLI